MKYDAIDAEIEKLHRRLKSINNRLSEMGNEKRPMSIEPMSPEYFADNNKKFDDEYEVNFGRRPLGTEGRNES
jgi:hypothetical protein